MITTEEFLQMNTEEAIAAMQSGEMEPAGSEDDMKRILHMHNLSFHEVADRLNELHAELNRLTTTVSNMRLISDLDQGTFEMIATILEGHRKRLDALDGGE